MAFTHSKQSRVMVNDKALSCSLTGWSVACERTVSEVTTLCDDGARFIPGLRGGTITLNGLFDGSAGAIDETIQETDGVQDGLLTSVMPAGTAIGSPAFISRGNTSSYTVEATVSDAVSLTVESAPNDGVDHGRVLHGHTAETVTGNSASVDGGAATTNGGVAMLHVSAVTGTTPSMTAIVQHSVDDAVWVDLITFGAATAVTAARQTTSATVNRYVRDRRTMSGTTPNFTYTLAFARR
jgi:hypothetical protein